MLARLILVFGLLIAAPLLSRAPALAQAAVAQTEAEELFQLGYGLFEQQEISQARSAFEGALRLHPEHQQARSYLIECLVLEGDLDGARVLAEQSTDPAEPAPEAERAERAVEDAHSRRALARAAKEQRKERRNPRRGDRIGMGIGAGGAAVSVGAFGELRPGWFASGVVGVGGFLVKRGDGVRGAVAVSGELQLSPVPWRLTPLLGVGVVGLFGPGASAIDDVLYSPPMSRGNARLVPYALLGARYDFRRALWFSLAVRLAPSPATTVMPIPGARLGLRF